MLGAWRMEWWGEANLEVGGGPGDGQTFSERMSFTKCAAYLDHDIQICLWRLRWNWCRALRCLILLESSAGMFIAQRQWWSLRRSYPSSVACRGSLQRKGSWPSLNGPLKTEPQYNESANKHKKKHCLIMKLTCEHRAGLPNTGEAPTY